MRQGWATTGRRTKSVWTTAICGFVVTWMIAPTANAILRRHDREDARFLAAAHGVPSTCAVEPDGSCVLIAPRWVLTAAHVAAGMPAQGGRVRFGAGDEARWSTIRRVVFHPQGQGGRDHQPPEVDLALLELEDPPPGIVPTPIYRGQDELTSEMVLAGYGDPGTGQGGPQPNDTLCRAARNVVVDAGPRRLFFLFDAPPAGVDLEGVSGPGDSGGPAFLLREEDGGATTALVAGISSGSRGEPAGRYGVEDIYVRVSRYAEWIDATALGATN